MQKSLATVLSVWLLASLVALGASGEAGWPRAQGAPPQTQGAQPQAQKAQPPTQGAQPQAGQSQPAAQPRAEKNMPALAAMLRKTVAFLTVNCRDGDKVTYVRGTAFFVAVEDKRLGERSFIYLVTNRHVVEPEVDGRKLVVQNVSARLNTKSPTAGVDSAEVLLPLVGDRRWHFPQNDAVDLAAMPLAPPQDVFDYTAFPASLFVTKDIIKSQGIGEGDPVLFAGFFYQFPGQKKMQPIVRQGVLAMMPDEEMTTTLRKPGRLFLADAHAFAGNSGAPMFVNVGGFRAGGMILGGYPYRLLGIVSGYFFETQDFRLQVATTLSGTANANSGISLVVPADELKALLDSPELGRLRDAEVQQLTKQNAK